MSGKRLIVLLLFVAVVGAVTTAYLRGWFLVSSHRASEEAGGDIDVRLTTDRAKLEEDAAKVRQKSADMVGGGEK